MNLNDSHTPVIYKRLIFLLRKHISRRRKDFYCRSHTGLNLETFLLFAVYEYHTEKGRQEVPVL